ncbi:MAG: DUF5615 family PIN-like protein [Pirellulales bacterium]
MAGFYSNENFPLPTVQALRELGHDVVTIQERGRANEAATDPEVLDLAAAEGRIVLTLNRRDFIRLHAIRPEHHGIVVCTIDPDVAGQAARIHAAIGGEIDFRGRLIRVNRPS